MMRKLAVAALLIVACGVQKATAQACTLTVTSLDFGTYTGTLNNGTANGTVNCGRNQGWSIGLNAGNRPGATVTTRQMTSPAGTPLSYQLFRDGARSLNWGDTQNVDTLQGTGNGRDQTITVYGQLAAGQVVAPGTYTDTINSATTSFTVTVVIQATCTISASDLNFLNYSGAQIDGTSMLTVTCTNLTPFDIGLNQGTATGATVTNRKMTSPALSMLSYSMFRDSGRLLNWGNTVGADTLHKTGTGSAVPYTVYGRVPAGQLVRPGTYKDTIIATVTY